jgi:membrane-associated phospholipid phosphatase
VNRRSPKFFASAAQLVLLATLPAAAQDATPTAAEDAAARKREETRKSGLPAPAPVLPPPERVRFIADPLSDGAVLSVALGIGALSEAILNTGEIKPQVPGDASKLLPLDRGAVDHAPVAAWATVSSIGLVTALGFAAVDPVASGFRDGAEAGIVDAFIYGETLSITWSTTNLTKIAFRRPRPSAYRKAQPLRDAGATEVEIAEQFTDTNSAMSFFSGHASITAAVTATASYLAFTRAPKTPRPWVTLGVGTLVTALTCVGRVQAGEHFPTDVIAGAMVGFGIGILVPHLHRAEPVLRRPVWIGAAPVDGGGVLTASGLL